jgi:GDP-4-dehydro-6-deoxy-D-mannose reductase
MVALVTGASGFAGTHLTREILRTTRWRVVGLVRHEIRAPRGRYVEVVADVTDLSALRYVLRDRRPDYIFHLAAATPPSDDDVMLRTNVGGVAALLEATLDECPKARLLIVGSDAQYGPVPEALLPTQETAPMHPTSVYGRSKVLQEEIALQFWRMAGLHVVCVRPFNHIGPGQSERFVVGSLAKQIAMIETGRATGPVQIGDVHAARDFTDVRDVVRAYMLSVNLGEPGAVYNIGSGVAHTVDVITQILLSEACNPFAVHETNTRVRPTDVRMTLCDSSRLRQCTGWEPVIPIEETLRDSLTYWRKLVRAEHDADATPAQRLPGSSA